MAKKSPEEYRAMVDDFMENKTNDLNRDICKCIRKLFEDCGLVEEFKWRMPVYSHHGMVCSLGAFKQHVAIWFMQGVMLSDPHKILIKGQATTKAMRSIRFEHIEELDENILVSYVKEAMLINESGKKFDFKKNRETLKIPVDFEKTQPSSRVGTRLP